MVRRRISSRAGLIAAVVAATSLFALVSAGAASAAKQAYALFNKGRIVLAAAAADLAESHGCVRLAPSRAAALFALVRAEGPGVTRITIANGQGVRRTAAARAHRQPGRILTAKRVRGAWSSGRRRW